MKSCITRSLVPSLRGGPWVLWDDLPEGFRKASEFGFDSVELFTDGPNAGHPGQLKSLLSEFDLSLGAVGTGASYSDRSKASSRRAKAIGEKGT